MGLREYQRKRDFAATPEPRGGPAREREGGRSFVVQKHAATRLHYDFRLEMEGVLKSWAVPKGPSLDPAEKRLAMETEDHPIDYGDFEGVIPEGQYGGGTVVVWDRGTWEPKGNPHQDYRAGALKFTLHGQKLKGGFMLVKIRGRGARDEKSWLLIKEKDEFARPGFEVASALPNSVVSGRSLEEVAADRDRVWNSDRVTAEEVTGARPARRVAKTSAKARPQPRPDPRGVKGARRAALPDFVPPQLATLVDAAPDGDQWLHEMKLDGYRILSRVQGGRVRLLTRQSNDWTEQFAPVARALETLDARQALLDGEVAILMPDGTTSFQALQNAGNSAGQLVYFAFDLLHLDGYDLRAAALESRKELLRALLAAGPDSKGTVRYSEHVAGSGPDFFAQACRLGLEGIVSKRRDAPYQARRSRDWLKVKCVKAQEVVIGGYTPPQGSRVGIGALLVGVHDGDGKLRFAGKVGTGFGDKTLAELRRRLGRLEQRQSPFADRPPRAAHVHWVRPELVAEVAFGEWTDDGRMRHPSFKGLREDKPASQVVREATAVVNSRQSPVNSQGDEIAGVRLTHPERVVYPEQGITKKDLALFYESIAERVVPHLRRRPTTLVRCPEGLAGQCFYQKHTGYWAPDTLKRVKIREAKKVGEYLVVDDLPGLVGLVQIGILEVHTWNSTIDRLEQPDRLVFDLDPDEGLPWERTIEAAERVREALEALDLVCFLKTTGGKGLHVVVPLQPGPEWDEVAGFAEALALRLVRAEPQKYVATMSKAQRRGKVFIDYMRNHRGATSISAYSTRAKPAAPVSTPLAWEELTPALRSDQFTVKTLPARLRSLKEDPWASYGKVRQRLTQPRLKAVAK